MAKAYTRAAKRRAKKALPELAAVPRRDKNGCFTERTRQQREDPQRTALEARCRHFGADTTAQDRLRVSAPHMGCQIGKVMERKIGSDTREGKEEIAALWQTICRLGAAYATYRRRYIGQAEEPACQAIMVSQEFDAFMQAEETTSGHDDRTSEERDRAAVNNWMRWQGYLGELSSQQSVALHSARRDDPGLWVDTEPTERGLAALSALRELRRMVDRR